MSGGACQVEKSGLISFTALPLWVESGMTNVFISALLAGLCVASAASASASTFTAQVMDKEGSLLRMRWSPSKGRPIRHPLR